MERIEISPASAAQLHRTRVGRNIQIADDVQNVARDLRAIDPSLHLEFDPGQEIYIVFQTLAMPDGSEEDRLVTTWDVEGSGPLDQRLAHRVRQIASEGYDYVAELDRIDEEAAARQSREFREGFEDTADRLASALLKDLGEDKGRVFLPGAR